MRSDAADAPMSITAKSATCSAFNFTTIADGLRQGVDRVWYGSGQESVSYSATGHDTCFAVEDGSFWFGHRNACLTALLRRLPPSGMLFDIGGGNGFVSKALQEASFRVALVEPGSRGVQHAQSRGVEHVICATLREARFHAGALPAVGLFDVLEHIEDELGFLGEIHRCLAPGGRLYMTVPAHLWLWSHDDLTAGHFRRYSRAQVVDVLRRARFAPLYSSYFFSLLPLPLFCLRTLPSRFGRRSLSSRSYPSLHRPRGGASADRVWQWEQRQIASGQSIPFGSSCLVAAEKPRVG